MINNQQQHYYLFVCLVVSHFRSELSCNLIITELIMEPVASPSVNMVNSPADHESGTPNSNMMGFTSPKTVPMLAPEVISVFQCFIHNLTFV